MVDKMAQTIIQRYQVPIHMSNYWDLVWCDVLDKGVAHILLGKPWLYGLDVISFGMSNTYEFKFNRKKIVLKPVKPKSTVGNNKVETITDNEIKKQLHLVTKAQFLWKSMEEWIMYALICLGWVSLRDGWDPSRSSSDHQRRMVAGECV